MIAPTRELAVQIHNDALVLGKHTGLKLACVFGGVDYEKQRRQFDDGADILIGTPGRIIDYYKQHVFDLRHVQVCVLDEADRMFDLGFIADIRFMLRKMPAPADRQSMLFSATLSQRVLELAYEHMNNPELIRIEPDKITADKVRQLIYFPAMEEKIPLLIGMLRARDAVRTMVFVNTRRMADRLEEVLRANHINAQALSGDVPQNKRLKFLKEFHSGELAVLIATDVASRGLHIPGCQPRVQLRPAAGLRRLRAPHRPHRARRRRGRCHQLRLRGIRASACRTSRNTSATRFPVAASRRSCWRRT